MPRPLLATIAKADKARQIVTAVVLSAYEDQPDGGVGPLLMSDALNSEAEDWAPPRAIEEAAYGFLANSREINAGEHFTPAEMGAAVVESYCLPYPSAEDYAAAMAEPMQPHRIYRMRLGDDVIHSGDWVMSTRLPADVWAQVEAGELGAYSIEGLGSRAPMAPSDFPTVTVIDLPT